MRNKAQNYIQKLKGFYEEFNEVCADATITKHNMFYDFSTGRAYHVKWDNVAKLYEKYSDEDARANKVSIFTEVTESP